MLILSFKPGRVLGWAVSRDGIVAHAGAVKYSQPFRKCPVDHVAREPLFKYGLLPHLIDAVMDRLPDAVVFQGSLNRLSPLETLQQQHLTRWFHLRNIPVHQLGARKVYRWSTGLWKPSNEQLLAVARLWATRELAQQVRLRPAGEAILTACYLAEQGVPKKKYNRSRWSVRHRRIYKPRAKYVCLWDVESVEEIFLF